MAEFIFMPFTEASDEEVWDEIPWEVEFHEHPTHEMRDGKRVLTSKGKTLAIFDSLKTARKYASLCIGVGKIIEPPKHWTTLYFCREFEGFDL
jgi:hypothetical protein